MLHKPNQALDVAATFFILSGGLYFLYYVLTSGKLMYLPIAVFIFMVSFLVRHVVLKMKHRDGFTDVGMFFVALVFLAYTLHLTGFDPHVTALLPDHILVNAGAVFIFLFLLQLIKANKKSNSNVLVIFAFIALFTFQNTVNALFATYPHIASLIIGTPYLYLITLLLGLPQSRNQ